MLVRHAPRGDARGVSFRTTRWSLIRRATSPDDPDASRALDELCRVYWPAVYGLYRAGGRTPDEAADLTQGLFTNLLQRGDFATADRARGPFRSWLRACARNWLASERQRAAAGCRGGGVRVLSLDVDDEEQRRAVEPVDRLDPDAEFERRWAQAAIENALQVLRAEEHAAGRGEALPLLEPALAAGAARPWAHVAAELGTTEGAARVAAHRLRRRFRDLLVREVRETLDVEPDEPDEPDEPVEAGGADQACERELQALLAALRAGVGAARDFREGR